MEEQRTRVSTAERLPGAIQSFLADFQDANDIFKNVRRGNQIAVEFINEVSLINSRAISNIIVAYDPDLITIGGSVALNNPDIILGGIKRDVDHYLQVPES